MQVTSAFGNSYHSSENVQSGQFSFQAVEAGDYMACFYAVDHQPRLKIPIEFDWRSGVAAKDWSTVAKKGSVDVSLFIYLFFTIYNVIHLFLCYFFLPVMQMIVVGNYAVTAVKNRISVNDRCLRYRLSR
ncbi:putative transmembrane emp24 domain-containing protein [Helianthus annuus]|nr:putative transmembrane emp24 domain-containing protein [Helianthus annuus]